MFRIPKDMIGRRLDIIIQNIPTVTLKITSITDDEVVGTYADGEEWHLNQSFIMGWTPSARKEMSEETKQKIKDKRTASKSL